MGMTRYGEPMVGLAYCVIFQSRTNTNLATLLRICMTSIDTLQDVAIFGTICISRGIAGQPNSVSALVYIEQMFVCTYTQD